MLLTDAQQLFLSGAHYAVVGTINADGSIQQTLVWYIFEHDEIRFGLAAHSVKARNLQHNPAITITVHADKRYLTVSGRAVIEPPDPDLRWRIAARYLPPERIDEWLARPVRFERATVRMTIHKAYGQGVM